MLIKNEKKTVILSLILSIIILLISWLSFFDEIALMTKSEGEVFWNNVISNSITQLPEGDDSYYISTPEQLAFWSKNATSYANSNIQLMNNIDMSNYGGATTYFTPIESFNGTFEGNGFTISGLNIYAKNGRVGLIGRMVGGTVKNLNLKEVTVYNVGEYRIVYVGLIVAYASNAIIINCNINNSDITPIEFTLDQITNSVYFGTIIGGSADNSTITIQNCFTFGDYDFSEMYYKDDNSAIQNISFACLGGIIADLDNGEISLCMSSVSINGVNGVKNVSCGGIVGEIWGKATIEESCNLGKLSVGHEEKTDTSYCGGIVGLDESESLQIQYCYNTGDISAYGNGSEYEVLETINNVNPFNVDEFTRTYVGIKGGVLVFTFKKGEYKSGGWYRDKIFAGGLVGYLLEDSSIFYCYNTGNVDSNSRKYIKEEISAYLYKQGSLFKTLSSIPILYYTVKNVIVGNEGNFDSFDFNYNSLSRTNLYSDYKSELLVNNNYLDYWDFNLAGSNGYEIRLGAYLNEVSYSFEAYYVQDPESPYDKKTSLIYHRRSDKDFTFNFLEPKSNRVNDIVDVCDRFEITEDDENPIPILKNMYWKNSNEEPINQIIYKFEILENNASISKVRTEGDNFEAIIPQKVKYNGTTYNVTIVGENSFFGRNFTSIILQTGITDIEGYAFNYCVNLSTITFPSSLSTIGSNVFQNCKNLKTITFKGTSEQWNNISKIGANIPRGVKVVCTDKTIIIS